MVVAGGGMQSGLSERTSPQSRAWVGILLSVIGVSIGGG